MKRKIIQLVGQGGFLWALCDDGTVWAWMSEARVWKRMPHEIPQDVLPV